MTGNDDPEIEFRPWRTARDLLKGSWCAWRFTGSLGAEKVGLLKSLTKMVVRPFGTICSRPTETPMPNLPKFWRRKAFVHLA